MAKDLLTQWNDAVWGAERPLFVLPPSVDTDIFAAACALGHALRNTGKSITILCPRPMSAHAQFLIGALQVITSLEQCTTYSCVIPQDIPLERVQSDVFHEGGGVITLHLAAQTSFSSLPALTFAPSLPPFDRIFVFGAQDLAEVAPLFSTAPELLSRIPLVTFSWHPASESFGRWNIVYEQASTLSEVVAAFLRESTPEIMRDHIATCALTGIIAKTKYFRTDLVTASMLALAADLVAAGAERLKIIEELYRTRSLDTLRLWGSACARLQEVAPGILFSELSPDDFIRTHSSPDALLDVAQEVLQSNEKTRMVLLFFTEHDLLHAHVAAKRPHDARVFLGALRTEGSKESALHTFGKDADLSQIVAQIKTLEL